MRLSVVEPPLFLLAIALVVENEADCSAAVTGPGFLLAVQGLVADAGD